MTETTVERRVAIIGIGEASAAIAPAGELLGELGVRPRVTAAARAVLAEPGG
jgi:hypothetical protein